jgi:hypothetical protein
MPLLISVWAAVKFEFFLVVGLLLIIPTNLVIFIRNLFPGHWNYRPFFLRHLYYVWLWIWRGEPPTAPFIFIRPLLNLFMKGHFENRLRRLRSELFLRDGLSDAARSAAVGRLDAALERWKTPRFTTVFFTALLPGIISIPSWSKQLIEFAEWLGIHLPTDKVVGFVSRSASTGGLIFLGLMSIGYLLAVPATAFLAKRGLFIGRDPGRICFPGGQGGSGVYAQEREILGRVGLRVHEAPLDLWLLGAGFVLSGLVLTLGWDHYVAWMHSLAGPIAPESASIVQPAEKQVVIQMIVMYSIFVGLFFVAALRRRRVGRA